MTPSEEPPVMIPIKDDGLVRIQALHPPSPEQERILICFTGIGHRMGGMNVQKPEFFSAGNRFDNVLYFNDLTRSWGNAFDLEAELASLAPYLDGRRTYTLGNSMGGTLAILAADYVPIEACAAVTPQFSVDPAIMPGERRWQDYRNAITEWRESSLEGRFNDHTFYGILSADVAEDAQHRRLFPRAPNIIHLVPQPSNHSLARNLKEAGHLQPCLAAIWEGRFSASFLEARLKRRILELSPGPKSSWFSRWRRRGNFG